MYDAVFSPSRTNRDSVLDILYTDIYRYDNVPLTNYHPLLYLSRMSVKRISQQAKEELAKQSAAEETMLRRASMADAVSRIDVD